MNWPRKAQPAAPEASSFPFAPKLEISAPHEVPSLLEEGLVARQLGQPGKHLPIAGGGCRNRTRRHGPAEERDSVPGNGGVLAVCDGLRSHWPDLRKYQRKVIMDAENRSVPNACPRRTVTAYCGEYRRELP